MSISCKKNAHQISTELFIVFKVSVCYDVNKNSSVEMEGNLEMVLGFPIARVEISKEKSVVYHPEYKGVRLDIYAQDRRTDML